MENRRTTRRRGRADTSPPPAPAPVLRSKSPARKSPARKSPARKASPPPARRASPARKPSPARRAISRAAKGGAVTPPVLPPLPVEKSDKVEKISPKKPPSPTKKKTTSSIVHSSYSSSQKTVETIVIGSKDTSGDSEIAKITSRLRRSISKTFDPAKRLLTATPATTETSRLSRSVSQSVYDDDNFSKTEYSDNEAEEQFKSFANSYGNQIPVTSNLCRNVQVPREFGGLLGVIVLLISVPALTYYLQWCCSKTVCEFQPVDWSAIKKWNLKQLEKVFDSQAVSVFLSYTTTIYVLSALPLGKVGKLPHDRSESPYYFNSFVVVLLFSIGFIVGEYLQYGVADYILKNYLRYCLFSVISAQILSFWLYLKSRYSAQSQWNPYAKTGNFLYDFALGRDINPKWFDLVNIKQVFYRISLVSTLLLAGALILRNLSIPELPLTEEEVPFGTKKIIEIVKFYASNTGYNVSGLLSSGLLLLYVLDSALFEHHLASSFELQHEGVGSLLLTRYAVTPFLLAAVPKYVLEYNVQFSCAWAIPTIAVIFLLGLLLKRASNVIKYQYRMNPTQQAFNQTESLHTFQGRRLLLGGLWGRLRQPNYTGEILMFISSAIPLYFKFAWPPLVCVLLCILFFVHRAVRVNARNFARYNSAWTRYCARVKYAIVPKVF